MTKDRDTPLTIGFLGPAGSHSAFAAQALTRFLQQYSLPFSYDLQPQVCLDSLMEAVTTQNVSLSLVPYENAIHGSVIEVLETLGLKERPLEPILEFVVPVRHCLIASPEVLALKNETGNIQTGNVQIDCILSHPQALGQCRHRIQEQFGNRIQLEWATSTSEAVRSLNDPPKYPGQLRAAIGTADAASQYGLTILEEDMSDAEGNLTRFFLLARQGDPLQQQIKSVLQQFAYKTSYCLGFPSHPGSLVDVLLIFKPFRVNMTKIESRPNKQCIGEYLFYIDADCDTSKMPALNDLLRAHTTYFHTIGSYAVLGELS